MKNYALKTDGCSPREVETRLRNYLSGCGAPAVAAPAKLGRLDRHLDAAR